MRQITTFPPDQEREAKLFADYLASLSIETQVDRDDEGWLFWIRDEDKIPQAKEELTAFREKPDDERYLVGAKQAQAKRAEQAKTESQLRKKEEQFERRRAQVPERRITLFLIGVSVLCFLLMAGRGEQAYWTVRYIFITDQVRQINRELYITHRVRDLNDTLPEVRQGQVWRLITPIFIHFGILHILGNMFGLFILGSQIESKEGKLRMALLVLVIAVLSNLAQYYLSPLRIRDGTIINLEFSPTFGGMSGVVFGLFGYVWMKSVFQPSKGFFMTQGMVLFMLLWLFLCMTGKLGAIANTAHVVGLLVGLIWGYYSSWWQGRTA